MSAIHSQQHSSSAESANPFEVDIQALGSLSPRRRGYIQQRNSAQDRRMNGIAVSIRCYQDLVGEVRKRYSFSKPEEQYLVKPYLTILYYEVGQLFESQEKVDEALKYYEQAGLHGHVPSLESARRLGSRHPFPLMRGEGTERADGPKKSPDGGPAFFKALNEAVVFIESASQKGSGFLVRDQALGGILITVEHLLAHDAVARIGRARVYLRDLERYTIGSNVLFLLGDLKGFGVLLAENLPSILPGEKLHVGEEVYFGGYSFGKRDPFLHRGRVSSVADGQKVSIDGIAVSGMSGGPIAIEREGNLYIVGTIASETFDSLGGFSEALGKTDGQPPSSATCYKEAGVVRESVAEDLQGPPGVAKTTRDTFHVASLDHLKSVNPNCFQEIWDDLFQAGVVSKEGEVAPEKVADDRLGLREEYQCCASELVRHLRASSCTAKKMAPSSIEPPYAWKNTQATAGNGAPSLAESLSTGSITGHLLREFVELQGVSKNAVHGRRATEPVTAYFSCKV